MMRRPHLLTLSVLLWVGVGFSQSVTDSSGQSGLSPNITVDCSDPLQATSPDCGAGQQSSIGAQEGGTAPSLPTVPQLRVPPEANPQNPPRATPANPSQISRSSALPWPQTEFEQMVADSAGRPLPLFGQSLFDQPPSTFAPLDLLQVPSDYIIGPGDELQIRIWGQLEAESARDGGSFWPDIHPAG